MSLSGVESKASDNAFVHSQLGYSYITIRTVSLKPALERLKAAGITPLANGPAPLPGVDAAGPHLAVVRDPDGNLVELIGTL
jgi:catechol 2,3-dioxygenase-like lactoylglutathione lyase family enzyme